MVAQDLDRTWEAVQESPGWIGEDARLWAVVLAGGQGMRLRPLTRRIHGEARPKQFAAVLGARSLLRQTLDRAATAIPLARTVAVTVDEHAGYVMHEIEQGLMPRVLEQPADRGTAAGVLLPVHWVSRQDPEAIVVVLPSDHFIDDAERFMAHVEDVAAAARAPPPRGGGPSGGRRGSGRSPRRRRPSSAYAAAASGIPSCSWPRRGPWWISAAAICPCCTRDWPRCRPSSTRSMSAGRSGKPMRRRRPPISRGRCSSGARRS